MTAATDGDVWDVVVVGGGGCGLAAALAAAEQGARVRVLEKDTELGGNTARSVGSVPGAGTRYQQAAGVQDSPDRFIRDLSVLTDGKGDGPRTEQMCRLSADLVHWLVDSGGIALTLTEDYRHVGHSVNRLHNPPSREGVELIAGLERAATALGATIDTSACVSEIRVDEGRVDLVVEGERVSGRSLVLATDGFGASAELKQEHCPEVAGLQYFGSPANTGDGIRWGVELGGQLADMTSYLGYAVMAVPREGEPTYQTLFSWTVPEMGGIAVDRQGRRFGNEDLGYSAFCDVVVRSSGGESFVVFDQRRLDYVAQHEQRFRLLAEREDTPFVLAESLAALAGGTGMREEHLRSSVEDYNAAAVGDAADPFGRALFGLGPLVAPFYACPTRAGLLTTQGGLLVDENARVLLQDGSALPTVYAGGSTAAGLSGPDGGRGYASGNGLLTALGYGMLAGRHAGRLHSSRLPA